MQTNSENSTSSLTFAETQFLLSFRKLIQNKANPKDIINFLKNTNHTTLIIKLTEFSPTLESFCQREDMHFYWDEVWKLLGCYPSWKEAERDSNLTYRPLKPQANISSFDLVRGIYFYDQAKKLTATKDKTLLIYALNKAAKYHNFHALQALTNLHLKNLTLNNIPESLNLIQKLNLSVSIHGPPVFILSGFLCFNTGQIYEENNMNAEASVSYQNTLMYLYAAEYSSEAFTDAIHNAYYGRGFIASNPLGISDIHGLRNALLENVKLDNEETIHMLAKKEGENLAKSITKSIKSNLETDYQPEWCYN